MADPLTWHEIDPRDWPELAARFADQSFEQTRAYSQAAARRIGASARFVALSDAEGAPRAAAAIRVKALAGLGRGIAWIPSGPMMLPGKAEDRPDRDRIVQVLTELRRHLCDREGHVLRLRLSPTPPGSDDDVPPAAGFAPAPRPAAYRSFAIDLDRDEAALMAALHGKWRTELRSALKSGLTVECGTGTGIEARFLDLYRQVQAAKGFAPDVTPEFHFALAGDDHVVETLIATRDGRDLAGIVVVRCAASATYAFGATAEAGRAVKAGYLLQWEAIARARASGCRWYDLGGVDFQANPDVARFKERMNGCALLSPVWQALPGGMVAGGIGRAVLRLEALRHAVRRRAR